MKRLIPLMLVGLWATDAGATEIFEKVGTVGAQFLKIGVGARAAAMGEAFTPIADDATALYWNPAGIARLEGNQITLNHASWPAEIGHEFVGSVFTYGAIPGTFGVSMNVLQMKPMNVTTAFKPNGTGDTFDAGDLAINFTYARMLTNKFSFGGTLRWVHLGIEEEFAEGVMTDFGTLYD
ncbi:MAG: PorV/PorQ family protein, partial [Actinobacteria bacterium]|nr:PorV/PorQ family protein [Actinomycetota bacterium]